MNPNVRYIENKNKQKKVNRIQPVGCTASTEVGNVEPLGHVCRWKKKKKNEPRKRRPVGCEARAESNTGTLGGRYNQARRKGFKRE